ncbi:MAG: alpha/beta hydrolase [Anaerolineales bacterium]
MSENITHTDGTFMGPYGKKIYHQAWIPERTPRAVLLLTHGLKEHSRRYGNLVQYFTPLGYAIYGYDQPGHGRSGGTRTYIDDFQELTDILQLFVEKVQSWQPDIPLFMYSHSFGTLISLTVLPDHQKDFRGAIFSGTVFSIPEGTSPLFIIVGKFFSKILPKLRILPIDVEGISRDPRVIQDYRDDPLVFPGKTTARLGAEIIKAIKRARVRASEIGLPTLILQGSEDRVVDPQGAHDLYRMISSPDKTLNVYQGYFHELHNEPEPERKKVFEDVETWLERQLSTL